MASVRLKQLAMEVQAALPSAEEAMQHAEKWLACRDQHEDLLAAVNEVLHALKDELSMERSAKADYSRSEDRQALTEVVVDLLMSLFRTEYRTPQRQTPEAPPFGRVLVVVGPKGVPDGLKVLNISSMARAEGTSELVVENRLASQGNLLLTPKDFEQRMAWLGSEVLAGRIGLPYHPQGANI